MRRGQHQGISSDHRDAKRERHQHRYGSNQSAQLEVSDDCPRQVRCIA